MTMPPLLQTPLKAKLNRPHDVVLHNYRYVVADTYNNRVVVVNPSSKNPRNSFWSILCSKENFRPQGLLALSETDDHFLITDMGEESKGCVYELKTGHLNRWAEDYEDFMHPIGIAAKDEEEVYVADARGDCIHVFDINGKFVKKLGQNVLVNPWFLTFNSKKTLYVTDYSGIHVFSPDGQHIERLKTPTLQLSWHYRGIATDEYDNIFVTARSHNSFLCFTHETVTVFDKNHKPLEDVTRGWWTFNYLRGICVDKKNNAVVVVDGKWHRIQLISYNKLMGKFLFNQQNNLPQRDTERRDRNETQDIDLRESNSPITTEDTKDGISSSYLRSETELQDTEGHYMNFP